MKRRFFLAAGGATMGLVTTAAVLRGQGTHAIVSDASVRVSAFGSDTNALQRAIDSGVREVVIDTVVTVLSDIRLRSLQTLRFAGGSVRVPANARIAKAVLNGEGLRSCAIVGAIIKCSGSKGVTGIRLSDTADTRVEGGQFLRANLVLESNDGAAVRGIVVSGLKVDMDGWRDTAVWISGINGVTLSDVECSNGLEGIGIYNDAQIIRLIRVQSHGHVRDGFVVIAGQGVSHDTCQAYDNGQSGFTTQRQTDPRNTRNSRWTGCTAWNNGYDGFDMRGAVDRPWGVATGFTLTSCRARDNRRCGFYVVMAEGTTLIDCAATGNDAQNLFIDSSDDVVVRRFQSISGASTIPSGPNKAGILVYNSQSVWLDRPMSRNDNGATQDFGVSLTGRSGRGRLTGGALSGNNVRSVYAALKTLSIE